MFAIMNGRRGSACSLGKDVMRISLKSALLAGAIAACLAGQAQAADGPAVYDGYKAPKDSSGRPDLTGVWNAATMTPLQRLPGFGDRITMTPAEVEAVEGPAAALRGQAAKKTDPNATVKDLVPDGSGNYNAGWLDPGTTLVRVHGEPRNSILTTPDGNVPPDLKGRILVPRPQRVRGYAGSSIPQPGSEEGRDPPGRNDNPESRGLSERCILGFSAGVAILPSLYNSTYSIQQSPNFVAIESEMIHDVRIVPLNAKHRTDVTNQLGGDAIGWYEGATLVVETTRFDPRLLRYGASEQLKVTERFTRVSPTRLHYAFTLDDPKTWAKPWGGEYELTSSPGIYEYACHEGNYGLEAILAGARQEEAAARTTTASK
ncbi:MAG: hypothetical protein JWO33_153 [Caulobacteraceae bacterium]|nr:hypothetical protein [Caulobacteraceae bacterium]